MDLRILWFSLFGVLCFIGLCIGITLGKEVVVPYPEPDITPVVTPVTPIVYFPDDIHIDNHEVVNDGHHISHKPIGHLYIQYAGNSMSKIIGKELDGKFYKRVDNKYIEVKSIRDII